MPRDYRGDLVRAIVSFELRAARADGKLKLGQNRGADDRRGVIERLEREGDDAGRALATMMRATLPSS